MEKVLGVQTFREDLDEETEFMIISYWESVQAIAAFTGADPTRIHYLERDCELLCCLLMAIERGSFPFSDQIHHRRKGTLEPSFNSRQGPGQPKEPRAL